jgi:hypothetical protein
MFAVRDFSADGSWTGDTTRFASNFESRRPIFYSGSVTVALKKAFTKPVVSYMDLPIVSTTNMGKPQTTSEEFLWERTA